MIRPPQSNSKPNKPYFVQWHRDWLIICIPEGYTMSSGTKINLHIAIQIKNNKVQTILGVDIPDLIADIDETYR